MTAVLNDASLVGGAAADDAALLLALGGTLHALRQAVTAYDEGRVSPHLPHTFYELTLPSGTPLRTAITALRNAHPIMYERWRAWLKNPGYFDASGDVDPSNLSATELTCANAPHPALRATWLLKGILWSASRAGWGCKTVHVRLREPAGEWRDEEVTNAHQETLEQEHRAALERLGLRVLPCYVNPGHHDPTSPEFIKYKNEKSQMPLHAARILRHAVPEDGTPRCSTWWACCEHGFFHRYDGSNEGGLLHVHWNGTSNPNATGNRRDIRKATAAPTSVKDRLAFTPRVADCGCREVDR